MPDLNWAQWALIGLYAFVSLHGVATIGQQRKPRTAGDAALGLVIAAALVWLVVKAGAS